MPGGSASRIRRRFQRLSRTRGQVPHALRTLSPLPGRNRGVRLACLIHAASVHSEPGSNSPSLKSPMRRRSAPPPVDSIKVIKGFFSGRSPRDRSRGNHSIFKKIMFAHIALLGFQRAGGRTAVFRHANYFTPPFRFCKRSWRFFSPFCGNPTHSGENGHVQNCSIFFLFMKRNL